jgi:hypothetical protein
MSGDSSIRDVTDRLNQLKANPATDFRFAPEEAQKYSQEIQTLLDQLNAAHADIDNLSHYGNVGTLPSAVATKQNLTDDVAAIRQLLDQHIAYLQAFQGAVETAGRRLQAADTP